MLLVPRLERTVICCSLFCRLPLAVSGFPASSAPRLGYEAKSQPRGLTALCFLWCHGPWPGCLLLSTFRVIGLISLQHPEILVVPSGKNHGKCVYSVFLEAECHPWFSVQRWQDPPEVTFCLLTAFDHVLVPLFSQLWKPLPP